MQTIHLPDDLAMRLKGIEHDGTSIIAFIDQALAMHAKRRKEMDAYEALTSRQRQMLRHVADGMTAKAIASRMSIEVKTVEFHLQRLRKRLGIREVALLTRFAVRVGAVEA